MWTFEEIYNGALNNVIEANKSGIYEVYIPNDFEIIFNDFTDATADENNIKSIDLLKKRWDLIQKSSTEEMKHILYIGQTTRTLRKRVFEFAQYGYGKIDYHRGGYPIWQLSNNKKLLIDIYPCDNPEEEETKRLDKYIDIYKTEPLANIATGKGSRYILKRKTDTYILR